jgi:hypothetical protein
MWPAQNRSVTSRNEIAVLSSAWKRLINDDWHFTVAGHMRELVQSGIRGIARTQLATQKSSVLDWAAGHCEYFLNQ